MQSVVWAGCPGPSPVSGQLNRHPKFGRGSFPPLVPIGTGLDIHCCFADLPQPSLDPGLDCGRTHRCSVFPFLPLFLSLFHVLGNSQFKSFSKCFLSTKLDRPKKLKSTITNDSSQLIYNLTYITIRLIAELVETRRHSVYFNL